VIEFLDVSKRYQSLRPLRIASLTVARGDRLALGGFDAAAAEMFVNLVTGAAVPDSGDVRVDGRSTREIATDTEWLASLDRFGIVTERSVLLESLSVEANLALPFTLAIEPVADEVRARVGSLALEVGLTPAKLHSPAASLSPEERIRAHLARALGPQPQLLLLEHPTARLEPDAAEALGRTLRTVTVARGLGWVALTEDERFAHAAGGHRLRLEPASGKLIEAGFWRKIFGHA
jgi:predicted ABC-type transport system involved in lysophospholipase L1 biosynthesis ATPase subunit